MTRILRSAMTQTRNAYQQMPGSVADLAQLGGKLDELRDSNLAHHEELIGIAAQASCQILCMGELFAGPYFALGTLPLWKDLAEDALTGPTVTRMCKAAKAHQMILVAPIYELDVGTGKRFNTAVVIDRDGSVLGSYRKTHIPVGTNDQGSFHETHYYERSDGKMKNGKANVSSNPFFPVFQTELGRIGIAICYDRHFAGAMKTLAENGAEVIFSPAVTFGAKSQRMWELEFPVDAARLNVFVGGSNRAGVEPPWEQEYFGQSYFVGPNGRPDPVAVHENLVVCDLPLHELGDGDPSGWNLPRDLRTDIY